MFLVKYEVQIYEWNRTKLTSFITKANKSIHSWESENSWATNTLQGQQVQHSAAICSRNVWNSYLNHNILPMHKLPAYSLVLNLSWSCTRLQWLQRKFPDWNLKRWQGKKTSKFLPIPVATFHILLVAGFHQLLLLLHALYCLLVHPHRLLCRCSTWFQF